MISSYQIRLIKYKASTWRKGAINLKSRDATRKVQAQI